MPLASGTYVGPYEILSSLGVGGAGEVYRARDTRIGREVAVKILPSSFSGDPDRLRRFDQEARGAGLLNHPNILAIYDVGTYEGCPYVVSELLEGDNLRERMNGAALPSHKAINYALQIAHGLAAAHDKGIVHRDLKPENVFVTKEGRIKILDFGLVKLMPPENIKQEAAALSTVTINTNPGMIMGTVGYMSPEQVRSLPVDYRSDIFSFGIVLYEMLWGERAFKRSTSIETLNAILNNDPPKLDDLSVKFSPGLDLIVRRCLEKSPEERFQSARDLAFNLESLSILTGSGPTRLPVAARRLKQKHWLLLAGVLVLVAVTLGSFFIGRKTNRTPAPLFQQITFRRGTIQEARFAPDGHTVFYSAWWDGKPSQIFWTRPGNPESSLVPLPAASLLSISAAGEMAILLSDETTGAVRGTLARVPLAGGAPREVIENIAWADWDPSGTKLAVVREVDNLVLLEYPIGTLLYKTNGSIVCPRVAPDGASVAFIHRPLMGDYGGSVILVDRAGVSRTLSSGWSNILGLAWSATGDEVWFTAAEVGGNRALFAVNLSGETRLVGRLPNRLTLTDISRDGRVLLSRETFQGGMMVLPADEEKEKNLSWFDGSLCTDLSDDGKSVLFVESRESITKDYIAYLRKTDGSPAVQLGDGFASDISPDGKWVLSIPRSSPAQIVLLPTGPGQMKNLTNDSINHAYSPFDAVIRPLWFPDGKRILFSGNEPGKNIQCYVQDLAGGAARPVTKEGTYCTLISPDGLWFIGIDPAHKAMLYSLTSEEPHEIKGLNPGEVPLQWSADGRSIYIHTPREGPVKVYRLNLVTGHREFWKEIAPPSTTGIIYFGPILITPDGKSYAYSYGLNQSDLYIVEGLG